MSRELSAAELVTLRTRPLRSELYLVAQVPRTVWTSSVLTKPTTSDRAVQFTANDNATAVMLAGMTIRIDSAAGVRKGFCRLRLSTPGSPTIGIGETSEIDWANGDLVTVLDEFAVWPRPIRIESETTVYVDEVAYFNQHTVCNPVPIMGPNAVVRLSGGSAIMHFDASDSWVIGGGAITYSWSVTPAAGVVIVGGNTATPTITFTNAVSHRVTLAVTSAGVTSYGYRYVFVLPATGYTSADGSYTGTRRFVLNDCSGTYDQGGWTFGLTMYDDVDVSEILDRALCVLCSDDWHGDTRENIGFYTGNLANGRNNILCVGWFKGETIDVNPDIGSGTFQVAGPQPWLDIETNFPIGIFDDQFPTLPVGTSQWSQFGDLTVDKALWHMAHWRSTLTLVTDVYVTDDTRQIGVAEAPVGSMWRQLISMAEDTVLAHPACDKLARLFVRINPQYIVSGSRTFPDVFENSAAPLGLHGDDWRGTMNIERRHHDEASQIDTSGISYLDGAAAPWFSLSPGHIPSHHGTTETRDRLLLADQASANQTCGLINGMLNNEYPRITIPLAHIQKVIDIAPEQYVSKVIAAGDTPRGIVWPDDNDAAAGLSKKRLLPMRVSFTWDGGNGVLFQDLECTAESWQRIAVTGDPPPTPPPAPEPPLPPLPPAPPPAYSLATEIIWMQDDNKIYYSNETFDLTELNPTYIQIAGPVTLDTIAWFDAMPDGSAIFCTTVTNPGSHCRTLWRATNFRTSPAAPNWTIILAGGDVVLGQTVVEDFCFRCVWDNTLVVHCTCNPGLGGAWDILHGVYTGGAFVWTICFRNTGSLSSVAPFPLYNWGSGAFFAELYQIGLGAPAFDGDTNSIDNCHAWMNDAGQIYRFAEDVGTHYVRDAIGHARCLTLAPANVPGNAYLQGAWLGSQMMFVDASGNALVGDGCAMAPTGLTWDQGVIWPVLVSGGNFLVWQRYSTPSLENMIRVSLDGFTVDVLNRTGNYWAVAGPGNKTMINMCLMTFEA